MYRGFVGLLDVLAFTALVNSDPSGGAVDRYLECLRSATEGTSVDFVVFSDSIVLTITNPNPEGLLPVAEACSRLMFKLVQEGIPVRGAIAYGDFQRATVDGGGDHSSNVFVAGRPIIEAYDFEQKQDWVGIMLAPSAVNAVPDLRTRCAIVHGLDFSLDRVRWAGVLQGFAGIPFHGGEVFSGFAIVPTNGELSPPTRLTDSIKSVREKLDWLRVSSAPTPAAQRKYQHTLHWLGSVEQAWLGWLTMPRLPIVP